MMDPAIGNIYGVLYLINKSGRFWGRTKLQKMIMLGQKEVEYPFDFEFVRYNYGPFSFQLFDLVSNLVVGGFLKENDVEYSSGAKEAIYQLTEDGKEFLNFIGKHISLDDKKKLDVLWSKYHGYSMTQIVVRAKEVYGW